MIGIIFATAGSPASPRPSSGPFNADFYITAATVIPVLYLALAVQGSALEEMLTWARGHNPTVFTLAVIFAGAAVLSSLLAEWTALHDIYRRQSDIGNGQLVLRSLALLLIAVAIVTSARVAKIGRDIGRSRISETGGAANKPGDARPRMSPLPEGCSLEFRRFTSEQIAQLRVSFATARDTMPGPDPDDHAHPTRDNSVGSSHGATRLPALGPRPLWHDSLCGLTPCLQGTATVSVVSLTKTVSGHGVPSMRIRCEADIEQLRCPAHYRRMITAAWRLGSTRHDARLGRGHTCSVTAATS